jgi:fatty acid desaturase
LIAGSAHAEAALDRRREISTGLEAEIAALRRLRPGRRTTEIFFFGALWTSSIVLGMWAMESDTWAAGTIRVLAIGASALALDAFFLLSHEGHHHLLFRTRAINHGTNILLCLPLLHSPTAYRVLHELHHRFLGGPGDPEDNYSRNPRRWALQWVRLTIGPLVYVLLIPVLAWRRAGASDRSRMAVEYGVMGIAWALAFAVVPIRVLLQVWLLPAVLLGYLTAVRFLAQHSLTDPHDPLLASRSVRSNPVVTFFLLNENYHLEHHLFPGIPSYNLPRLHALLRSRLPHSLESKSYSRFLAGFVVRVLRGDGRSASDDQLAATPWQTREMNTRRERQIVAQRALRESPGAAAGASCKCCIKTHDLAD